MDIEIASPESWKNLYKSATEIKKIEPWHWMHEADVFGVQHPKTKKIGFVSVMGSNQEHYALAAYLGAGSLYRFLEFHKNPNAMNPEHIFELPQLQASFENRDDLYKEDYQKIKELGLRFRGKHNWPMFRRIDPGFVPWFLKKGDVEFLTYILEQAYEVSLEFENNPSLFPRVQTQKFLIRTAEQKKKTLLWKTEIKEIEPPIVESLPIQLDFPLLHKLKKLSQNKAVIEIDFFMIPTPIQEEEVPPYFPYMLMMVETHSGMILGHEVLKPKNPLAKTWQELPNKIGEQFAASDSIPKGIKVSSLSLFNALKPLTKALNIELYRQPTLDTLELAKEYMSQMFNPS